MAESAAKNIVENVVDIESLLTSLALEDVLELPASPRASIVGSDEGYNLPTTSPHILARLERSRYDITGFTSAIEPQWFW